MLIRNSAHKTTKCGNNFHPLCIKGKTGNGKSKNKKVTQEI